MAGPNFKCNLPPECYGQFKDRAKAKAASVKGVEARRKNRGKRMLIVSLVREVLKSKPRLSKEVKASLEALGLDGIKPDNALMLIASGFNNAVKTGDMAQIREFVALGGYTFNSSEEALEEKAQDNGQATPTEIKIIVDDSDGGGTSS